MKNVTLAYGFLKRKVSAIYILHQSNLIEFVINISLNIDIFSNSSLYHEFAIKRKKAI